MFRQIRSIHCQYIIIDSNSNILLNNNANVNYYHFLSFAFLRIFSINKTLITYAITTI